MYKTISIIIILFSFMSMEVERKVKKEGFLEEKKFKKINDSLWIQNHEVTNAEYRDFLLSLERERQSKHKVDSIGWVKIGYHNGWETYYHSNRAFNDYPVVNISYESAVSYCHWLTSIYNNMVNRKYKKVIFKLPSLEEWRLAAINNKKGLQHEGLNDGWFYWGTSIYDINGELMVNFRILDQYVVKSKESPLYPVKSFIPKDNSIYCLYGNAAEMTEIKGVSKGGSWKHFPEQSVVDSSQYYNGSECWLGFRTVLKVIEP